METYGQIRRGEMLKAEELRGSSAFICPIIIGGRKDALGFIPEGIHIMLTFEPSHSLHLEILKFLACFGGYDGFRSFSGRKGCTFTVGRTSPSLKASKLHECLLLLDRFEK